MIIHFDYQCCHGSAGAAGIEVQVVATFTGEYRRARTYPIDDACPEEYPDLNLSITLDGESFLPSREDWQLIDDEAWTLWEEQE